MKQLFVFMFLVSAPAAHAATYECNYYNSDVHQPVYVDIDMKTQFIKAEGPNYSISGYAVKQVSKASERTFLILPAGISFPSLTIEMAADGNIHDFNNGSERFDCKISEGKPPIAHDPRAAR